MKENLITFMKALGYEPQPWQLEVIEFIRNSKTVPRHPVRRNGKTNQAPARRRLRNAKP